MQIKFACHFHFLNVASWKDTPPLLDFTYWLGTQKYALQTLELINWRGKRKYEL